jgi:uncharacterized protein YyaL (SSP411 family)
MIDALLELLQIRWRDRDMAFAVSLADVVIEHFTDPAGGFFFTSNDHETLIQRPRPTHDDAMPSGNGTAARVFNRLGHLLGEPRYLQAAESTLKGLWQGLQDMPHGHASLLVALEESLFPLETVIIRGPDEALPEWQQVVSGYAPRRLCFAIPASATCLPGSLSERTPGAAVTAWICSGQACDAPVTDIEAFETRLEQTTPRITT